jgi:tetratricopeptide (TPR) repeat protein
MGDSLHQFVDGLFDESGSTPAQELPGDLRRGPLSIADPPTEKTGDHVGHYRLLEPLGVGGFGTVWRAEQAKPVRREVALKIIKLGMDTREVIARFEAERQALAMLDHANIAKVFDAGATLAGRPYFVMELVRGVPITRYCAEHALALRERLELFAEVCRAVQHAHQKGIIHRDLKPSNLLVAEVDGKPMPKVIDFGIAKATGEEPLTDSTVTQAGSRIGTPAYMSPEQADGNVDIDTRTDLYSLGVVLYELLTGQLPHAVGPDGKVNRTRDPARPSKLNPKAKGDLDWIAMKALEHDRARRYESANALAEDVQCFLEHQPVRARPPTTGYLLRRFTQRNKLAVGAAAAIVLVLLAGVAVSTWMYFKEKRALARSQQVSDFLKQVLAQAGPLKAQGQDATMMRKILDETSARIGTTLANQPEAQAELYTVITETYVMLLEYNQALKYSTEALRLVRLNHRDDEVLARALYNHARPYMGLARWQEGVDAFTEALAIRQRLYGEDHLLTATVRGEMAWGLMRLGRVEEAEQCARLATAQWRKQPDQSVLLGGPQSLAMILHNTNRHEECVAVGREELAALQKRFGPEHSTLVFSLDNLAYDMLSLKLYDEAEPMAREALRQSRKYYPAYDDTRPHIYGTLLRTAAARGDWEGQLAQAREFVAERKAVPQPDPRDVRAACSTLARTLLEQAEHFAPSDAPRALTLLDELTASEDFTPEVKTAGGWVDCLRGMALQADPTKRDEAKALLTRGVEAMKKKEKPAKQDTQRIKKAEGWLAKE